MDTTYLAPGVMTGLGTAAAEVARLPGDFRGIAQVLQGLCIHEFLGDDYGVTLTEKDKETVHVRRAEDLLAIITARDSRPLEVTREPAARLATNCRGFTVLAVAMLRAHGVPARARCGFGTYFGDGFFTDHWVVEYHEDGRWKRGDAQIDPILAAKFGITFDLADMPSGQFLTGGEAWQLVRGGGADPGRFGLSDAPEMHGDWWIAGNLVRDVAAVDNGIEVLPWDCWAPMPEPGRQFDNEFFDRMAAGKEPTTVPDEVYSAVRHRMEPLIPRP